MDMIAQEEVVLRQTVVMKSVKMARTWVNMNVMMVMLTMVMDALQAVLWKTVITVLEEITQPLIHVMKYVVILIISLMTPFICNAMMEILLMVMVAHQVAQSKPDGHVLPIGMLLQLLLLARKYAETERDSTLTMIIAIQDMITILMDAPLDAKFKMDGIVMEVPLLHQIGAMKNVATDITLEPSNVRMETPQEVMVVTQTVKSKMDGTVTLILIEDV